MPLSGRWLELILVFLVLWLAFLCWLCWGFVRQARPSHSIGVRGRFTLAGIGCSIVAVASLLLFHVSWISVSISQHFGVAAIRVLAQFLFWPTLAGLFFSAVGSGKKRFWALGSCLITGLWWLSLAMTAAISMGAAPIARHPTKFFVPAGYVGWVAVKYGETKARSLPMTDGTFICQIPPDGLLETSSFPEQGWAKDEYLYYSKDGSTQEITETGWGRGGMIWGNANEWQLTQNGSMPAQITTYFYVGTEEGYHHAVSTDESRPFNESASQDLPAAR